MYANLKTQAQSWRSDAVGILSQHSGSEFVESCVVPGGCELNSKGPVQHHLPICTFYHAAVDQVTVADVLLLTGPVTLEVVFSCPSPCLAVRASDRAGSPERLGQ